MTRCLSEDILQAYCDGELAPGDGVAVLAHLARCAHCAAGARQAEQALATIAGALDCELPAIIPTTRLRARIESAESATQKYTFVSFFQLAGRARTGQIAASTVAVACLFGWLAFETADKPRPEQVPLATSSGASTSDNALGSKTDAPTAVPDRVAQQPVLSRSRPP